MVEDCSTALHPHHVIPRARYCLSSKLRGEHGACGRAWCLHHVPDHISQFRVCRRRRFGRCVGGLLAGSALVGLTPRHSPSMPLVDCLSATALPSTTLSGCLPATTPLITPLAVAAAELCRTPRFSSSTVAALLHVVEAQVEGGGNALALPIALPTHALE